MCNSGQLNQVILGLTEKTERREKKEMTDTLEKRDLLETKGTLEQKGTVDHQEPRVLKGYQDLLETKDSRVNKEIRDRKVDLGWME